VILWFTEFSKCKIVYLLPGAKWTFLRVVTMVCCEWTATGASQAFYKFSIKRSPYVIRQGLFLWYSSSGNKRLTSYRVLDFPICHRLLILHFRTWKDLKKGGKTWLSHTVRVIKFENILNEVNLRRSSHVQVIKCRSRNLKRFSCSKNLRKQQSAMLSDFWYCICSLLSKISRAIRIRVYHFGYCRLTKWC